MHDAGKEEHSVIRSILTPQKLTEELKTYNLSQIAKKYGVSKQYITQLHTEYQAFYPDLFPKKTISKEKLEKALKTQTIASLCIQTGLSYYTVRKLIRQYGLQKDTATARFDEKDIRRKYLDLWWSDAEIAETYGCSASLVKKFRYNHGILKTDRAPLAERLTRDAALYLTAERELSLSDICRVFDSTRLETEKLLGTYGVSDIPTSKTPLPTEEIEKLRAHIRSNFVD